LEIIFYDQVDSTNNEAKRLVASGRSTGFAVCAASQSAGRGRFDRVWQTLRGNLAITIVVNPSAAIDRRPTIALMNGLAIFDVVQRYVSGGRDLAIKWPNDILIDRAKVSGTLIEADGEAVYTGIGINVATKPQGLPYPTAALSEIAEVDIAVLARELVEIWTAHYRLWDMQGFEPLISSYNSRLYKIGEKIRFALDRNKADWISGKCMGVNAHGHLLISDEDGRISIHSAGDVDIPR
jgi:BirA family transcriptional regulator, biotin operon repressor / biotin---[acetyl-CoA-carboxylase] ligase